MVFKLHILFYFVIYLHYFIFESKGHLLFSYLCNFKVFLLFFVVTLFWLLLVLHRDGDLLTKKIIQLLTSRVHVN